MENVEKLKRCGLCGRYFRGDNFLSTEELKNITKEEIENAPLDYCPDAHDEQQEKEPQRYVTKDMAIDAGYPEMEGEPYNF